ncbi:hypothetical protein [Acuticoccus sp. I52.16.1]|uniref:hypothetical protein n=1 Tax=Acuticoccus sp. I52.16.1 TaxID=2928472 RepID=UPI001FD4230D|nr:hypothetical protein [Acuticoccus sp. I52.16.1]UOM36132.1 hypothetical protein MRB58_08040 [Acuticoccus sp. I52.16.1]
MQRHGVFIVVLLGAGAFGATAAPMPLPGLLQPLADPLTPGQAMLSWCGALFALQVAVFALAALRRPGRAFGTLVVLAAIGASFCLGPVVALLMSGAVLAALPLVLGQAPPPRPAPEEPAAPSRRPRRLFA